MAHKNIEILIGTLQGHVTRLKEIHKNNEQLTRCLDLFMNDVKKLHASPISYNNDQEQIDALNMLCAYLVFLQLGQYDKAHNSLDTFLNDHPAPNAALIRILTWSVLIAVLLSPIPLIVLVNPLFGFLFIATAAALLLVFIPELLILEQEKNHQYAQTIHPSASSVGTFFHPTSGVSLNDEEIKQIDDPSAIPA